VPIFNVQALRGFFISEVHEFYWTRSVPLMFIGDNYGCEIQ
jgi:hypothetical protein